MKKNVLSSACAVALGLVASTAFAADGIYYNANIELDYTHLPKINAPALNPRPVSTDMGGRVEFNVGGRNEIAGGNYLEAKGTALLKSDGSTAVDDMWLGFGNKTVQFKAGRFEAYDLFPMGKDTLVDTVPGDVGYKTSALRGRFGSGGSKNAHITMNTTFDGFGFELGLVGGSSDWNKSAVKNGIRPVVYFNAPGGFKVAAGYENIKYNSYTNSSNVFVPEATISGYGLTVGYNLMGGGVNFNFSKNNDYDQSMGLNGTWGDFGLGYVQNKSTLDTDKSINDTIYAAYSFPLMGIKGATITPALSYSTGKDSLGNKYDNQTAARVRFNYGF